MSKHRLLRLLAVLGILSGMLVVTAPAVSADPSPGGPEAFWDGDTLPPLFGGIESDDADLAFLCYAENEHGELFLPGGAFCDGAQEVYFASVGHAEDFGLGPANTSVTIQNIDEVDAYIFFFVGNGDGWDVSEYAYLAAGASKTFTASDLGIAEGTVVPVVAVAYHVLFSIDLCDYVDLPDGEQDYYDCGSYGDYPSDAVYDEELAIGIPAFIAGVAKQAVTGDLLPMTTSADTSVSGYNAVSGREVGFFDQLYQSIVQTNCGPGGCWDTVLRIANVGLDANAAVTVRFFPADDGSGSLQTGFQLQALVDVGETWSIWLSDYVPEGWVGSVHVFSDDAVVGIADRYKAGTDMWITNTFANAAAEWYWQYPGGDSSLPYVLLAPDVRLDYNGWNTGINVANTVDADNQVAIQYFGNNGNAPQGLSQRLAPHGMTYFYNPSSPSEDDCQQPAGQVVTCDFVGAAIVLSEYPVVASVDGVKYFGDDANVGQAFSYSATGNAYTDLALPLAQKGNPATGVGATSGINFLNPNSNATFVETWWINPSGFGADNYGPVVVWVPGFATGFVYTMFQHNLPNGFTGSALVNSELPVAATSANVDYQVQGDGTVVWNLYNPCGFFRQSGFPGDDPDCVYEAPVDPPVVNEPGLIVKTVSCPTCADETVVGATVNVTGTTDEGDEYFRSADTNATGTAIFAVPAGVYDVEIVDVPSGYAIDPLDAIDEDVEVGEGETVNLDNTVLQADAVKVIDTAVEGLLVCIYEQGVDQGGKPIPVGEVEDCELGYVELPKDYVPGQGEEVDRLREPTYDYLFDLYPYGPEQVLFEGDCEDFEYLEDYELFYDDYRDVFAWFEYEYGYNPFEDCEFESIPYVRLETLEELGERLGTVVTPEYTDEDGDATFELPAGCYYAVISGAGYETVVELFCLEPGETEVNEVNLGEAPGRLVKQWVLPFFDDFSEEGIPGCIAFEAGTIDAVLGDLGAAGMGQYPDWIEVGYTREECTALVEAGYEVFFINNVIFVLLDLFSEFIGEDFDFDLNVAMEVNICEGADVAEEDCDDPGDDTVFHGGADDFISLEEIFENNDYSYLVLEIDLAPGTYTLCYEGYVNYQIDDGDDLDVDDYIGVGPICETFTIVSEETTYLVNYMDDALSGVLDVAIGDAAGLPGLNPLTDILVQLYELGDTDGDGTPGELLDQVCSFNGEAEFYVPEGNYTVTATDSSDGSFGCGDNDFYETQDGSKDYTLFADVFNDGFVDDDVEFWFANSGDNDFGEPDVILWLDPALQAG